MKTIRALAASGIFVFFLLGVYYVHINYFKVDVVFYAAIFDAVLAAVVVGPMLWVFSYFRLLGAFERMQLVTIWLLAGYSLAISVPTVIDRSLSFYILEKIHQRGGGIRQDAFEKVFTREYVIEHRLVDVRLTEQVKSGTVEIKNGCVQLTSKGEMISGFSRNFRQNWLPKQRLLLDEYTDALTDPFRSSVEAVDYKCKK
jgi:hypothetical protein